MLARELLSESGSVFIQIGDENVHMVRSLLDEVFGAENFVSLITFSKTTGTTGEFLSSTADYLLFYAKDREFLKYRQLYRQKEIGGEGSGMYTFVEEALGARRRMTVQEQRDPSLLAQDAKPYRLSDMTSPRVREARTGYFEIELNGRLFLPRKGEWKTHKLGTERLATSGRIEITGSTPAYVRRIDDFSAFPLSNLWGDIGGASDKFYVVQTSTKILERCVLMTTDPGDLVLDPTCGSGTTAYVAEQWGRRWITTDTSRVALALARTRLMAGRFPYYHLADSPEGVRKETELTGQAPPPYKTASDIRKGFVYKRVPHVTLKAIANNDEIDVIHERYEKELAPRLARLNELTKHSWHEWEVPREADPTWPSPAENVHPDWWRLRRARQAEIDASIARRADVELLYDQPYEDNQRVRVTGPFTVESLSPHRMISVDDKVAAAEEGVETAGGRVSVQVRGADDFGLMIIGHMKANGVQNGIKNERLKFERLEPFPGAWIHASGEYLEDGESRRVAVCIGPEFGTVGPDLVKEAAKEAVRGVGFDLLLICGFAFDPHVNEEAKRYGALTVLPTKMNPDLAMGDELLKKTGAGNLFMVFGEPDITIGTQPDGELVVEIRGLDVYDPTTGVIRNSSIDDIACWFIDTNYNAESFFVRHAYFTGADKPYDKLQRTLRAEIDEDAWASLYSTRSRPFPRPETGRIAVKVINHYGDEVLKVYEV